jgi:tRNA pseudouridine synthase 10
MLSEEIEGQLRAAIEDANIEAIAQLKLCDSCLGRLFGKVGRGATNAARGETVRTILRSEPSDIKDCQMCKGLVNDIKRMAELAIAALKDWEHTSFLIGTKFDPELVETEESMWAEVGTENAEAIKAEFNREIGKIVESGTGKTVEFSNPDIVAIVDTLYETVNVQVSPMFIYGRYKKFTRGIPQTRWPCNECKGKGCEKCNNTGKMYQTSVEEQAGAPALEISGGSDHRFHGMGREDIDALMLGSGRPFVLEIKEPRRRFFALSELENLINGKTEDIEVSELRSSNRDEVIRIKEARPEKKYRVKVHFTAPVPQEKIYEVVGSLGGNRVAQRTPNRVLHRRADRERQREIKAIEAEVISPNEVDMVITAEAGTYVKEFIHGDDGRTVPSVSGELDVGCEVKTLDVLEILDEE